MNFYLLLGTLFCAFTCSISKRDGAPTSVCSSMMPSHWGDNGILPEQRTSAPFIVSAVKQGKKVRVTISSPSGVEFGGFMLQARRNSNRNEFVDGEFTSISEDKTIDCFRRKRNTLTHVSPSPKKDIVTEWMPRGFLNEDVVFRATVAKNYAEFWTAVDSTPVRIRNEGPSETSSTQGYQGLEISTRDCFVSKGCFGLPDNCVRNGNCEMLLTYSRSPRGILFGMQGILEPDNYMAMALSGDDKMGDDRVIACYTDGSEVTAQESWNDGKRNVRHQQLPKRRYDGSFTNGLLSCNWTSPLVESVAGTKYDLNGNNYYLLLARGSVENNRLGYHFAKRLPSGDPVDFSSVEPIGAARVANSIKIHGTFMVTAWVGFVSMAILLARHFKNTWETSTLGGVKIWFALHRGFMLLALAFFVIAFIVIFVYKKGWSNPKDNPHAILGCIATALGVLNPIMALFRPGPDHKKRPIFNWLHFGVGNIAHLFAVITIFFAVKLPASGLNKSFYWVMGIFVVVYLVFHILYQTHSWTQSNKKNNDLSMNEMNGARSSAHNGQNAQEKNVSGNVLRILLLGIYTVFLFGILIALYALIGVA